MEVKLDSEINSRKLYELFKSFGCEKFLFVEPGGNCGDYLIYKGAKKLADFAGISYKSVSHDQYMAGNYHAPSVVYIHGSGGFVPWWSGTPAIELKKALLEHNGSIILGPSSFATDSDYLLENVISPINKSKGQPVHIFCREETSYSFLKKRLPSNVNLYIDHDTALNLQFSDFDLPPIKKTNFGYFIREDKEGISFDPCLKAFFLDPGIVAKDFNLWVQLHYSAKKIVTNRLHSSIIGTILGKNVTLLPGGFHKNRSVWEYSLKDRNVLWSEDVIKQHNYIKMLNKPIIRTIMTSYKIDKVLKKILYGV